MTRSQQRIQHLLVFGLAGLVSALPASARDPKVQVQSQTTAGESSPPPRPAPPPPAARPAAPPARVAPSAPSRPTGDSGSSRSSGETSGSRSSSPSFRPTPQSPGDSRGGRNFEGFRRTREVERVGEHSRRHDTQTRRRHQEREHPQSPQRYRTSNSWDHDHHGGWYGYRYPRYGWYSPSYYCYYGAFGFWYPGFLGYGYGPGRRAYGPPVIHVDAYGEAVGALDLDVSPEEAEIYVDGHYVGIADNFDGFPTFLWLEEGVYDIAIYRPGYRTIFRQYTIYPGTVVDIEDRMQPGESVHPREHAKAAIVERVENPSIDDLELDEPVDEGGMGDPDMDESDSVAGEIGRVLLSVKPSDAAVYLNGHFLGTALEVAALKAGLVVDPGTHVLEVARPGYETRRVELEIVAGRRLSLEVDLKKSAGGAD